MSGTYSSASTVGVATHECTPPSGTPPYWGPGTIVTYRWGDTTGPHFAEPVRVVRDDTDALEGHQAQLEGPSLPTQQDQSEASASLRVFEGRITSATFSASGR